MNSKLLLCLALGLCGATTGFAAQKQSLALRIVVIPSTTDVRIKEPFSLALRVENPAKTDQTIRVMSCSWYGEWQCSNTNVSFGGWPCQKNGAVNVTIPPGGAYTNELSMVIYNLIPAKEVSFRMSFTSVGSTNTFWSNEIKLHIQGAENTDLLTNRINQAKALLAEFKKTKSLDELEKAYLAVGNIPEPGADKTVPKAVARREAARMCFSLLAVIHQNIDTNFDVNNPGNWPLLSIVPPVMPKGVPYMSGMDPKDIKNPKDRALYKAAIEANEKKAARLNFQVRLRNMDRLATSVVEIILRHDYTTSKKDQNELEDLMKQAKLSPAQMQKIMARFDKRDNKMP